MNVKATVAATLAALLVGVGSAQNTKPEGWFLVGPPSKYEYFTEAKSTGNGRVLVLKSKKGSLGEREGVFGSVMQQFLADDYRGKRIRLAADVKTDDVKEWAGLWLRVDGLDGSMKAFDNMSTSNRGIVGTTAFKRHEVVLDVPMDSKNIAFGVLVTGPGQVKMDNVDIDVVSLSVPVSQTATESAPVKKPVNLNFGS